MMTMKMTDNDSDNDHENEKQCLSDPLICCNENVVIQLKKVILCNNAI